MPSRIGSVSYLGIGNGTTIILPDKILVICSDRVNLSAVVTGRPSVLAKNEYQWEQLSGYPVDLHKIDDTNSYFDQTFIKDDKVFRFWVNKGKPARYEKYKDIEVQNTPTTQIHVMSGFGDRNTKSWHPKYEATQLQMMPALIPIEGVTYADNTKYFLSWRDPVSIEGLDHYVVEENCCTGEYVPVKYIYPGSYQWYLGPRADKVFFGLHTPYYSYRIRTVFTRNRVTTFSVSDTIVNSSIEPEYVVTEKFERFLSGLGSVTTKNVTTRVRDGVGYEYDILDVKLSGINPGDTVKHSEYRILIRYEMPTDNLDNELSGVGSTESIKSVRLRNRTQIGGGEIWI